MASGSILSKVPLTQRLSQLRKNMGNRFEAILIPSSDAHNSEYVAECDMRRQFLTGFTGSAGTCLITQREALLWTDSRYTLQAHHELSGSQWRVMNSESKPSIETWLLNHLPKTQTFQVAVDPKTFTHHQWQTLESKLMNRHVSLVPLNENIIDQIWIDRPFRPSHSLQPLSQSFTGFSWKQKVQLVFESLELSDCEALLVSSLDEIAWLLNLRGSDIPFNPVFFAFFLITLKDGLHFFLHNHQHRFSPEVMEHFQGAINFNEPQKEFQITIHEYDKVYDEVTSYARGGRVWFDPFSISYAFTSLWETRHKHLQVSPIPAMKLVKTSEEVKGMILAHILDGIALCRYLHYLEKRVDEGNITEISGAKRLDEFRANESSYIGQCFPTISAYGPNGAVVHYRPEPSANRHIGRNSLYLLDAGAHYKFGTTDVTRTIHLGQPSETEKWHFTLVLKGHIALSRLIFPLGTKGSSLDSHARTFLWKEGLDYGHGTGHGVGAFLNVHEGPCRFSKFGAANEVGLCANTFITIEPGYYLPDFYGIRIENVVLVTDKEIHDGSQSFTSPQGFLRFQPITCVPVQKKMILTSLLSSEEIEWINAYHRFCRRTLEPYVVERNLTELLGWLIEATGGLE